MGQRVWDVGESECRSVMEWIGVTSPHAKAGRLPTGVSSREHLENRLDEGKQMTVGVILAGATSNNVESLVATSQYREGLVRFTQLNRVLHGAFERLEPRDAKVSSAVLRGLGCSNAPRLPGAPVVEGGRASDGIGWRRFYARPATRLTPTLGG